MRRAAAFSTACRRRTAYAGVPYKTALQVVHLAVNQRVEESMQRVEGERPSDRM